MIRTNEQQETKIVSICILDDGVKTIDFLKEFIGLSRRKIKLSGLSKPFLNKVLKYKDIIELPLSILNENLICLASEEFEVKIIEQDDEMIIINKPYNIHGHPLSYSDGINILSFLRMNYTIPSLGIKSENKERGLLYRLDFVTSGVLIFIKNTLNAKQIRENFSELVSAKTYLCIVSGNFNKEGDHTHYFEYINQKASKALVHDDSTGTQAQLNVEKVDFNQDFNLSLLKVNLKTGLRHQIRAQLAFLNYPILGDQFYGGAGAERVYLHAFSYEIILEGELKSFKAKPDELFSHFFDCDSIL